MVHMKLLGNLHVPNIIQYQWIWIMVMSKIPGTKNILKNTSESHSNVKLWKYGSSIRRNSNPTLLNYHVVTNMYFLHYKFFVFLSLEFNVIS